MNILNLSIPLNFIITFIAFSLAIITRYFIFSGLFFLFFHKWYKEKWASKKVASRNYDPNQLRIEMKWSIISSLIFALTGTLILLLWQKGYTNIYTSFHLRDVFYIPFSILVFILLQETYYYWLHRWMHRPGIFKTIHKVHHQSKITSPFTAFSFHPYECILQAVFFVVIIVLPIHLIAIAFLLILMTLSSIINHLDIEIYPENFNRNFIGKWIIGATHHSQHHTQVKSNYGLYFTIWDRLKNTESKNYDLIFDEISKRKNPDSR